jgi:2-isopropylmalate synthase
MAAEATSRARDLRAAQTDAEAALWRHLRDRRFHGWKFRRQAPLGPYVADFVCFEAKVIVEADGGQHADNARDAARDRYFLAEGYSTLRFWNMDIHKNIEGVLDTLREAIKEQNRAR